MTSIDKQSLVVQPSYRWAARIADLGLWTPLAFLICVPIILAIDASLPGLDVKASNAELLTLTITSVIFTCLLMLIDTLVGMVFGNTPGKYLMRIQVTEADGAPLTASSRLKRNMGVAVLGMGLSIPLLGWLFMIAQYFIVRTGRKTTYDSFMGYSVSKTNRVDFGHGCIFALVLILAMTIQALSTKLANEVVNPHGWYIGLTAIREASRNNL